MPYIRNMWQILNFHNTNLHVGFTQVIKTTGKKKKRKWYVSENNHRRRTKHCYNNDICKCKRDSCRSEVEIRRGIIWIMIFKKRIFRKI